MVKQTYYLHNEMFRTGLRSLILNLLGVVVCFVFYSGSQTLFVLPLCTTVPASDFCLSSFRVFATVSYFGTLQVFKSSKNLIYAASSILVSLSFSILASFSDLTFRSESS
jgi:hypothetical protein